MTTDNRLFNRMILHADDSNNSPGLLTGQMGVVIVVANYARIKSEPRYDHVADFLYDCAINHVTTATGTGFASGLAGICWGVKYLIQSGLMPGSGDEICEDLDRRIMRYDIRRIDERKAASRLRSLKSESILTGKQMVMAEVSTFFIFNAGSYAQPNPYQRFGAGVSGGHGVR